MYWLEDYFSLQMHYNFVLFVLFAKFTIRQIIQAWVKYLYLPILLLNQSPAQKLLKCLQKVMRNWYEYNFNKKADFFLRSNLNICSIFCFIRNTRRELIKSSYSLHRCDIKQYNWWLVKYFPLSIFCSHIIRQENKDS